MNTPENVRTIIETDLDNSAIQEYLDSSQVWLAKVFTNVNLGDDLKAVIHKWITAHMIAVSHQRTTEREKAGPAEVQYAGEFGAGLYSTPYGQTAIDLDPTGTLEKLASKKRAFLKAVKR